MELKTGFVKAQRKKSKLRLCLTGVSGSGKTYSSLLLAKGLGGKIAFIDTEAGSAQLYSDIANFDVLELGAPYSLARYIEAIKQAESGGYDILIIDSLSHAWAAEGGVLDIVDKLAQASPNKNSFISWNKGSKEQNILITKILSSPLHIICCVRSKTAYEIIDNGNGRKTPKKFGLAPVQRENLEYEFSAVLDISRDSHLATVSKNRTDIFEDDVPFLITEDTGRKFIEWLDKGVEPEKNIASENITSKNIAPKSIDEKPDSSEISMPLIIERIRSCNDVKSLERVFRELKKSAIGYDDSQNIVTLCAAQKEKIVTLVEKEDVPF